MGGFIAGFVSCYLATAALLFIDGVPDCRGEDPVCSWPALFAASMVWPGAFLGQRP